VSRVDLGGVGSQFFFVLGCFSWEVGVSAG
jgi:hypothetical protein